MDSWFREIHVPQAWHVYLATGLEFCKNKSCLCWVDRNPTLTSASYLATLLGRKDDEDSFSPKLHVRITDNNNLPHGKFIDFYFCFLANSQTLTSPHIMFSISTYIMSRVTHSEPGLPMKTATVENRPIMHCKPSIE